MIQATNVLEAEYLDLMGQSALTSLKPQEVIDAETRESWGKTPEDVANARAAMDIYGPKKKRSVR